MRTLLKILIILIPLVLFSGCHILQAGGTSPGTVPTGAQALMQTVSRSNWAAPFTALGVAGGVFAIFMGARKIGFAALAASMAATVHVMVSARYAWVLAILGLLAYVTTTVFGLAKNKETISGFVRGFQGVKDLILTPNARSAANEYMRSKLNTQAEKIVAEVKGEKTPNP